MPPPVKPYLDVVLRLLEQSQCRVPGAVGPHRHHILQLLQAVAQVRAAVLLQLIVGRPRGGFGSVLFIIYS